MVLSNEKIFRHYKGKHYRVISDKAVVELTGCIAVVYQSISTGEIFVRPYEDFYGNVSISGEEERRFAEIS